MKRLITILFCTLLVGFPVWAKQPKSIKASEKLAKEMAKENDLQKVVDVLATCKSFSYYGTDGFCITSKQYIVTKRLTELATCAQLDSLAQNGQNTIVKASAFASMCYLKDSCDNNAVFQALIKNLPDTSQLYVNSFDIYWKQDLSSFITDFAFSYGALSQQDSAYLDSLLFYTNAYSSNSRVFSVVRKNANNLDYYPRVKEIFQITGNDDLLKYIAHYRQKEDIPMLMDVLGDFRTKINDECLGTNRTREALEAITYWPLLEFREIITEYATTYALCSHFNYQGLMHMFTYVMMQDAEWGISFIDRIMALCEQNTRTDSKQWFVEALYKAYHIADNPEYTDIVDKYCASLNEWRKENLAETAEMFKNRRIQ